MTTSSSVNIAGLPVAIALTGPELVPVVQNGVTKQATVAEIIALAGSGGGGGGEPGNINFPCRIVSAGSTVTMVLTDGEVVIQKTIGSPTAVTLPSGVGLGLLARVSDGKGDASTNNISVSAAGGGTINGASGALVMNTNWGTTLFRSLAGNLWSIL